MKPQIGKFYRWWNNVGMYLGGKNAKFLLYKNSSGYMHTNNIAPFSHGTLDAHLEELSDEEVKKIKLELL